MWCRHHSTQEQVLRTGQHYSGCYGHHNTEAWSGYKMLMKINSQDIMSVPEQAPEKGKKFVSG